MSDLEKGVCPECRGDGKGEIKMELIAVIDWVGIYQCPSCKCCRSKEERIQLRAMAW